MNSFARQLKLITVASVLVSSSAFALSTGDVEALNQKLASTKVAELPATAAKLVSKASQADRVETAKIAVLAVAKNNPAALSTVLTAVLRRSPETTDEVVSALLKEAPEMVKTIVSSAVFATGKDIQVLALAAQIVPDSMASVRTEVASAKARRALSSTASKAISVDVSDTNSTTTTLIQTNTSAVVTKVEKPAYVSADPNRP